MGDNRDDSLDSRFPAAEGGRRHGARGKPHRTRDGHLLVDRRQCVYCKPWTWFSALRGSRIGNG